MNLLDSSIRNVNWNPSLLKAGSGRLRPTWAEISHSAFIHNLQQIASFVGPKVKIIPVLKANGYGHGSVDLARWCEQSLVPLIGVSSLEEGIALREAGIATDILILGGVFPFENFQVIFDYRFIPTVASLEAAIQLEKAAQQNKLSSVAFHLKVDTGMGRLGVSVEAAKSILQYLQSSPALLLAGVYSHFASADCDIDFTRHQVKIFQQLLDVVQHFGFKNPLFHLANSAGILFGSEAYFGAVRPGLMLYGISPLSEQKQIELKPVLSWKSRGIFLKRVPANVSISYGRSYVTTAETDILTVPVGYADGVPRSLSNCGVVLVRGQRCAIIGRVTMDHIMVDVTGLNVSVGEPVTLIGEQNGQTLSAWDWARWANTIPYEILCGISARVPREVIE